MRVKMKIAVEPKNLEHGLPLLLSALYPVYGVVLLKEGGDKV